MGILLDRTSDVRSTLRTRHLIGRSRRCDTCIPERETSSEHASMWWDGAYWWVRDLGARNGTFVGNRQLEAGASHRLSRGDLLRFGGRSVFALEDATAPIPVAIALASGRRVVATDGALALPDDEAPTVVAYRRESDGDWVVDYGDGSPKVTTDLAQVEVDGDVWRLHLPIPHDATAEATSHALHRDTAQFWFRVSRDQETVQLEVSHGADRVLLPTRTFWYTLLVLARARMADSHLPMAEAGWVDREQLCDQLKLRKERLAVDIYRARNVLRDAGIEDAYDVVQRRAGSVRLAVGDVRETSL